MGNVVIPDAHKTIRFCAVVLGCLLLGWRVLAVLEWHQRLSAETCPAELRRCLTTTSTMAVRCAKDLEVVKGRFEDNAKERCDNVARVLGFSYCYK